MTARKDRYPSYPSLDTADVRAWRLRISAHAIERARALLARHASLLQAPWTGDLSREAAAELAVPFWLLAEDLAYALDQTYEAGKWHGYEGTDWRDDPDPSSGHPAPPPFPIGEPARVREDVYDGEEDPLDDEPIPC